MPTIKKKKKKIPTKEQGFVKSFEPDKTTGERSIVQASGGKKSRTTIVNPNKESIDFFNARTQQIFAESQARKKALGENAEFIAAAEKGLIKGKDAANLINRQENPQQQRELTPQERVPGVLAGFKEERKKGGFIDKEALGKTFGAENLSNATFNLLGGLPIPDVIGPGIKLARGTKAAVKGAQAGGKGIQAAAETFKKPTQFLSGKAGDLSKQAGEGFTKISKAEVQKNLTKQFPGTKFLNRDIKRFTDDVNLASFQQGQGKGQFNSQISVRSVEYTMKSKLSKVVPTEKLIASKTQIANKLGISETRASKIFAKIDDMEVSQMAKELAKAPKGLNLKTAKDIVFTKTFQGVSFVGLWYTADNMAFISNSRSKQAKNDLIFGNITKEDAVEKSTHWLGQAKLGRTGTVATSIANPVFWPIAYFFITGANDNVKAIEEDIEFIANF